MGLVAEAGNGAICHIRRSRPPGKDEVIEDRQVWPALFYGIVFIHWYARSVIKTVPLRCA